MQEARPGKLPFVVGMPVKCKALPITGLSADTGLRGGSGWDFSRGRIQPIARCGMQEERSGHQGVAEPLLAVSIKRFARGLRVMHRAPWRRIPASSKRFRGSGQLLEPWRGDARLSTWTPPPLLFTGELPSRECHPADSPDPAETSGSHSSQCSGPLTRR